LPPLDDSRNAAFWRELARTGELRFERCTACGTFRHPPRELCGRCGSAAVEWAASAGRGAIATWLVAHQAFHPAFQAEVPYVVAVTALDEGVRLVSGVIDLPRERLRIGFPVEVVLQTAGSDHILPYVRPRLPQP
ncbi:MAG TPA: OB-fold domain-containing protein, partial [Myxococcota bacterium]|nr:OB-fold domain-containing protein [Myxococcota bacterium]